MRLRSLLKSTSVFFAIFTDYRLSKHGKILVFVIYRNRHFSKILLMSFSVSEPMLAASFHIFSGLELPLMASPKYDGIRCLIVERDGRPAAVTRTMKPIPNLATRLWLEKNCPIGFDGELVVKGQDFHGTSSAIMSRNGKPDFLYAVFDYIDPKAATPLSTAFSDRIAALDHVLSTLDLFGRVVRIEQTLVECMTELTPLMQQALDDNHEGLVIRRPDGRYKTGRSTSEDGLMLKLKPYEDAEAEIVGMEPERSDLFTVDRLGSFFVRLKSDPSIRFHVGTGLSDQQRGEFWNRRSSMIGKMIRFRYQSRGMKSAPRFPVFQGLRDEADL
jgi:DNA ligase-1